MDERQEERIIRYTDNALSPQERSAFESELAQSNELEREVLLEARTSEILRSDSAHLEMSTSFDAKPSAAILERLAATSPAAKSRMGYYLFGAAAIIVALFYYLLRPTDSTRELPSAPSAPIAPLTPVPQPVAPAQPTEPQATQQTQPAPSAKPAKAITPKPKKSREIDLDKDLGKPKIFTDPKGHMPIDQK
jgi:anti-sigma factor RsiW